jgi:SAM-dependent methyltransferase
VGLHYAPAAMARFHTERADLRGVPRWHRLAYIVRALPAALEPLAAELRVPAGGRVLDYGSADAPYRHLFPGADFVAADLPGNPAASLEIRDDGSLPAADESCDAVLSTQVLEHVADPALHLRECRRVLRPGGRLLLSTHGIMLWHPDPVDLWRWTSEGLRREVAAAGLEVMRFEGVVGMGAIGLQLAQDALLARTPRRLHPAVALAGQALVALADRIDGREARRLNACVFAVVAQRP